MINIFALLALGIFLFQMQAPAEPLNIRTHGISNTQALLAYQVEDTTPVCTIEVWEGDSPSGTLVHDVNPLLFPGSDTDNRLGNTSYYGWRVVVIGKRRAEKASDGKFYSRALQANTKHTARLTCGSEVRLHSFATENLPTGATQPENPAFDSDAFGNYAWPTIDWGNPNLEYIDPMTGVLIKRLTKAGEWGSRIQRTFTSGWAIANSSWTQPQNATSFQGSSFASTGTANSALFLALRPESYPPGLVGNYLAEQTVDDVAIRLYGLGTNSTAQNRTVNVCLSVDTGQTCYTDSIAITLPFNTAGNVGLFPQNFPSPMYAGWGKPIQKRHWPRIGRVTVLDGVVTLQKNLFNGTVPSSEADSSSTFDTDWKPGTRIRIDGSPCLQQLCTIQSVQHGYQLTLQESFTLGTETEYRTANLGFRIVKETGTGTVSINAGYEYAWSFTMTMPYTGGTDQCSLKKVTTQVDRNGVILPEPRQGFLCVFPLSGLGNSGLYFVDTDRGDFRFLSAFRTPLSIAGHVSADLPQGTVTNAGPIYSTFDPDLPNVLYSSLLTNSGRRAIFRLTYGGDYRELKLNYQGGEGGDTPTSIPDSIVWENLTRSSQGRDLQTQVDLQYPQYDKTRFGSIDQANLAGVVGSTMMFTKNLSNQDTACWNFVFDLKTGNLQNAFNTFDGKADPLMRWAGCHSTFVMGPYFGIANNILRLNSAASVYGGPFTTRVIGLRRGGTFQTNTELGWPIDSSYDNSCPGDLDNRWKQQGATGNRCITVRVEGEPCSAAAGTQELAWSPCPYKTGASVLQNLVEGDILADSGYPPNPDGERFRLVRRTTLPSGEIEMVLQRNAVKVYCAWKEEGNDGLITGVQLMTHANGWSLMAVPSGETCEAGVIYYDAKTNRFYQENRYLLSGHFDLGVAPIDSYLTMLGTGFVVRYNKPASGQLNREDFRIEKDPPFDGIKGYDSSSLLQSYGSLRQWSAPGEDRRWALDFRHINGPLGLRPESPNQTLGPMRPQLQPEAGTQNVYKLPIIGTVNYKRLPLFSFAGRHLLTEMSGTAKGNILTDATPWRFCYVYQNGECRAGSLQGELYAVVPGAHPSTQCWASQYSLNIPCAMTGHGHAGWLVQFDVSKPDPVGASFRRLSMGFSGPGRQYVYANARAMPDGKWAVFPGFWLDGVRQELLAMKLPPFSTSNDSKNRGSFIPYTANLDVPSAGTRAAVVFGYAEFGEADDFYCTARREKCIIGGTSTVDPFAFESEFSPETQSVACSNGCSINIPASADRVLYYRFEFFNGSGVKVGESPRMIALP
ncbi:hypothetical protein F183_A55230 (plasmid) [Bryobacterales bacterium F-183]|nr:hypothetical protein F183_A55230 [Bryobacterales bacterium F-183]